MGWALGIAVSWVAVLIPAAWALTRFLRRTDAEAERRRTSAGPPRVAAAPPAVHDEASRSS